MNPKYGAFGGVCWRTLARALAGAVLCGVAGGLFTAACGTILCLAVGASWASIISWGLRGVLAGLAAGATVGAISGFYHVEEPSPQAPPLDLNEPPLTNGRRLPAPPSANYPRSKEAGRQSLNAGSPLDYKEHLWN